MYKVVDNFGLLYTVEYCDSVIHDALKSAYCCVVIKEIIYITGKYASGLSE